ncbi:hypothetical protein PG987_014373 [Apiospora arundinis]
MLLPPLAVELFALDAPSANGRDDVGDAAVLVEGQVEVDRPLPAPLGRVVGLGLELEARQGAAAALEVVADVLPALARAGARVVPAEDGVHVHEDGVLVVALGLQLPWGQALLDAAGRGTTGGGGLVFDGSGDDGVDGGGSCQAG